MAVKSQEGYEKVLKFLKRDEKVKITFCEQLVIFFFKIPLSLYFRPLTKSKKKLLQFSALLPNTKGARSVT